MYSGYELCENEPASPANEEYLHSEKYEIKQRDWQRSDSLAPFITRLNDIRRRHPAFAELRNIALPPVEQRPDPRVLEGRPDDERRRAHGRQPRPARLPRGHPPLDLEELDLPANAPFHATDELTGATLDLVRPHPVRRASTPPSSPATSSTCTPADARAVAAGPVDATADRADRRWFQRAVFYEVLVRGFFDSNDDGTGDLRGITEQLDYLQWLGVDCLWLLPFYQSPLRDGGYDISDFFTILPEYGDLADVVRAGRGVPPARTCGSSPTWS